LYNVLVLQGLKNGNFLHQRLQLNVPLDRNTQNRKMEQKQGKKLSARKMYRVCRVHYVKMYRLGFKKVLGYQKRRIRKRRSFCSSYVHECFELGLVPRQTAPA
jgi:hypothetical protein